MDDPSSPRVPLHGRAARVLLAVAACVGLAGATVAIRLSWREAGPLQASGFRPLAGLPPASREPSLARDGSTLAFVTDVGAVGQIWIVSLGRGTPIQVTEGLEACSRPRWSPRGCELIFQRVGAGGQEGIWRVEPGVGPPRQIVAGHSGPALAAAFSPDGTRIAFLRPPGGLVTCAADGSGETPVPGLPPGARVVPDGGPAWAPDGENLAIFLDLLGRIDVWIVPVARGAARRLTFDGCGADGPVWTPDGREIIFSSTRGGRRALWSVATRGGAPRPVTSGEGAEFQAEVSRDGHRLLYTSVRDSHAVMVLDVPTGGRRELHVLQSPIWFPSFSPDGRLLAFFAPTQGATGLFLMGRDGDRPQLLTLVPAASYPVAPQWSADASQIFFQLAGGSDRGFRSVSVRDGSSVPVAPGWGGEVDTIGRVDPTGRLIAYHTEQGDGKVRTRVREIATGALVELAAGLELSHWSRDGRELVGFVRVGGVPRVAICPVGPTPCTVLSVGYLAMWSGDDSRIFFLRQGSAANALGLWVMSRTGQGERLVAELEGISKSSILPSVSSRDEVAWVQLRQGRPELWEADLFREPGALSPCLTSPGTVVDSSH